MEQMSRAVDAADRVADRQSAALDYAGDRVASATEEVADEIGAAARALELAAYMIAAAAAFYIVREVFRGSP
jgi:hypothetical protein